MNLGGRDDDRHSIDGTTGVYTKICLIPKSMLLHTLLYYVSVALRFGHKLKVPWGYLLNMRIPKLYPTETLITFSFFFAVESGICMFNKHLGDFNAGDCNAGQTQIIRGEILLINPSLERIIWK